MATDFGGRDSTAEARHEHGMAPRGRRWTVAGGIVAPKPMGSSPIGHPISPERENVWSTVGGSDGDRIAAGRIAMIVAQFSPHFGAEQVDVVRTGNLHEIVKKWPLPRSEHEAEAKLPAAGRQQAGCWPGGRPAAFTACSCTTYRLGTSLEVHPDRPESRSQRQLRDHR